MSELGTAQQTAPNLQPAIEWLARHDFGPILDVEAIERAAPVRLAAHLFGVDPLVVAIAVMQRIFEQWEAASARAN